MARTKAILEVVEFTNNLGQIIKPGDEVVIVTTGYGHNVSTNKGTYLGLTNGGASISKQVKSNYYVLKSTGERIAYTWFNQMHNEQQILRTTKKAKDSSYRYRNDPEYDAIREKWMSLIEMKDEFTHRRTTLKLNRAYKLAA
jgi:hypothetical protein